jgi:hypothetical protein
VPDHPKVGLEFLECITFGGDLHPTNRTQPE